MLQRTRYLTIAVSLILLVILAGNPVFVNALDQLLGAALPSLGTADSFAVLAGSTATNTGSTVVTGDLGVAPGTAITGFPPGNVIGTTHPNNATAQQAQLDLTTAYNEAAGQACDTDLTGQDLGGLTLTPGVYCFPATSAQLTGNLTLDAEGDPAALFIFQIGSTLTTASNSSVLLINSADACNVFWQVGSSATLGTSTTFAGSILAQASITLNTNASVLGRILAQTGAVTMDTNAITVCASGTSVGLSSFGSSTPRPNIGLWLLFVLGFSGMILWAWWAYRTPASRTETADGNVDVS
jgi:type VI secretion system secreted protein VgrG